MAAILDSFDVICDSDLFALVHYIGSGLVLLSLTIPRVDLGTTLFLAVSLDHFWLHESSCSLLRCYLVGKTGGGDRSAVLLLTWSTFHH